MIKTLKGLAIRTFNKMIAGGCLLPTIAVIYGAPRFCNDDFFGVLACANLSGVGAE
ncbi:hypothetical protein LJR267_009038 [Paraburkholderia hospita]|uniref:hypothetical protein n=1 Tax=Paraburkholderia hospita TaxID=169430 RepID=UPI0013FD6658|nr:hypothetical protein [Paraburkholderia hospita]